VPHISRFWGDVAFRCSKSASLVSKSAYKVEITYSHISQKAENTPNFLHAALDMPACAPFLRKGA
jgi:hypothetical protein